MLGVEGQTVHKSCVEVKHMARSLRGSALPSTLVMKGPWSCTTSMMEEDLYPAEHLFVRMLKDSDDLNETPYTATTTGYPLYKGSYLNKPCQQGEAPIGFYHNCGDQFISYPI